MGVVGHSEGYCREGCHLRVCVCVDGMDAEAAAAAAAAHEVEHLKDVIYFMHILLKVKQSHLLILSVVSFLGSQLCPNINMKTATPLHTVMLNNSVLLPEYTFHIKSLLLLLFFYRLNINRSQVPHVNHIENG